MKHEKVTVTAADVAVVKVSKSDKLQAELDAVNAERDVLSAKARALAAEIESMRVEDAVAVLSVEQKERLRKALA